MDALFRGDLTAILPVNFVCLSGMVHYYSMANGSPHVMPTSGIM